MKSRCPSILSLFALGAVATTVLPGCVPSGPLTVEQIAGEVGARRGAVRASGLPAAERRVVVVTKDGLAGFAF